MVALTGFEGPEELEELAFQKIKEGKIKDGLKLILRAAKKYEEIGKREDAARLYKYLGFVLIERTGSPEKARPSLLKSAYFYIDLIEEEIDRPEVDVNRLDDFCFSVLEIFLAVNDVKNLKKYAEEFAAIYEDLDSAYEEGDDVTMAIRAYESAYHYSVIIDEKGRMRAMAEKLITLYGQVAEEKLQRGDIAGAAEEFYRLAWYIQAIFGYDIHFMEMMDTAAKNFEKASKVSYSQGDLDGTTTYLVRAEYSYLLAKNTNRAKLIGINTARMLNQVIGTHRAKGNDESTAVKIIELAEALVGIGKIEEALRAYRAALETKSDIKLRVRFRLALLKRYCSEKGSPELLREVHSIEYYMRKDNYVRALNLAEKAIEKRKELAEVLQGVYEAEGIYQETQ